MRIKKSCSIIFTIFILSTGGSIHAGEKGYIKIANVSDFVMKQHLKHGEYVDLEKALDRGVVDKTVWWWDKGYVERFNLVNKDIKIPDKKIQNVLSEKKAIGIAEVIPPKESSGWTKVAFLAPDDAQKVLIIELNGMSEGNERFLTSIGIKTAERKIEDIFIQPEALFKGKEKSAFCISGRYFNYRLEQGGSREWLKENLESINGISILVLKSYSGVSSRSAGTGDKVFVIIDIERISRQKYIPEVILGWKPGEVIASD